MDFTALEKKLMMKAQIPNAGHDVSHDELHLHRVVGLAKAMCAAEGGKLEVVLPAAWLHDLVNVPKNDPLRSQASRLSAQATLNYLTEIQYPPQFLGEIGHAIEAHSFSANVEAQTIEARIVQDADRLDSIGAIGIARCFATAGFLSRPFYSEDDPFARTRKLDDQKYTLDHFYAKLLQVVDRLSTKTGRQIGEARRQVMRKFLNDFEAEMNTSLSDEALPFEDDGEPLF